jgi:hypothetical protein
MQSAVVRIEERRERAQAAAQGQRFDLYSSIHKGIRAFMAHTLDATGRMDATDVQDVAATLQEVRSLLGFLRSHLHHENQFLHPALEARRPGSACRTAGDHVEHERALEALEAAILAVERAAGAARAQAAQQLYRELALLVADNLEHMQVEETENNAALWATYSDAELVALHEALLATIPPAEMSLAMRWMVPAMAPAERAAMLSNRPKGMSDEVFCALLETFRPHLSARDWAKLTAAIGPVAAFN